MESVHDGGFVWKVEIFGGDGVCPQITQISQIFETGIESAKNRVRQGMYVIGGHEFLVGISRKG